MPGSNHKFTAKEDRMAKHVADSERADGMSAKKARSVGYATVNRRKGQRSSMRKVGR